MDKFTEMMLAQTGLIAMIGKAGVPGRDRSDTANTRVRTLLAVGGAAYLVAKAIRARGLSHLRIGMEAIYEFDVRDMPVTVAVSADGTSVHQTVRVSGKQKSPDTRGCCVRCRC